MNKRLRFEILRRDNHTCRYCGGTAPDVKLTVDHVVPVALGGEDIPSNLVTACAGCNSGKASVAPDQPLVDDVAGHALRWADAMQRAAEIADAQVNEAEKFREWFEDHWDHSGGSGYTIGGRRQYPLGDDWERSIENFRRNGLSTDQLADAVDITRRNGYLRPERHWRYFCGVCWTKVRQLQAIAHDLLEVTD